MATNTLTPIPANTKVLITNMDVTAVCVQNLGDDEVWLIGTNGVGEPALEAAPKVLLPGSILAADRTLASLWPGVTGVNRVWAFSYRGSRLSVSHA